MGNLAKQSVKYLTISYIGMALGYINAILLLPSILSEEVFGLVRILFAASFVVAPIAQFGASNIILRFNPDFDDSRKFILLSIAVLLSLIGIFIVTSGLLLLQNDIALLYKKESTLVNTYFYLIIPFVISLVLYRLIDSYLSIFFKNSITSFLNLIFQRVLHIIILLCYYFDLIDTSWFVVLYVLSHVIVTLFSFLYLISLGYFKLSFRLAASNFQLIKKIGNYGIFAVLSSLSFLLISRLDLLMIGKFMGLQDVAIYSVVFSMCTLILVPAHSISRISSVLIANASKNNDFNKINTLYKRTALNQLLLGFLIFMLISINYHSIIGFLPKAYGGSYIVFIILGLSTVFDIGLGANGAIIVSSEYYKFNTLFSIILLLMTFFTNIYFIPKYGLEGAAFATAVSIATANLLKYIFIRFKMGLSPFSMQYLLAVLICLFCYLISILIPYTNGPVFIDTMIKSAISLALFVGITYWLRLSTDFNDVVNSIFRIR